LAFTRYCHYQSCIVLGAHEKGRGTMHCAILFVGNIQKGEIKEAFRANFKIEELTRRLRGRGIRGRRGR